MDWHGHQSAWTEARTRCRTRKTHRWKLARKWESPSQRRDELGRFFTSGSSLPRRFSFRPSWHKPCLAIILAGILSLWHPVLQPTLNYNYGANSILAAKYRDRSRKQPFDRQDPNWPGR